MPIAIGDRLPAATFKSPTGDGIQEVSTDDIFSGKKVVLFAVPGAFTPTCNDTHLPGYLMRHDEIKARGVDAIVCTAVNDAFVLGAWAQAAGAGDKIPMLADGNGDFARAMGLELDLSGFGMGQRSSRYSALVEDGVVKSVNVEPGGEVGVSGAEHMLGSL